MDLIFSNSIEDGIDLTSTSRVTADVTPIILNETDSLRTSFVPTLIDNDKEPDCCVDGKFVHERKQKKSSEFPSEKISRKTVRVGDVMELSLSSSETKKLYDGLTNLYKLHKDLGYVPLGAHSYAKVDASLLKTIRQFGNIKDSFTTEDLTECISLLSKSLLDKDNIESLSEKLKSCSDIDKISDLSNVVNISKLKSSLEFIQQNMDNSSEEIWQEYLTKNQWIISQLFAYPTTIYKDKAFIGGKNIRNTEGKIVDYLYRNDLTKNVALIEIKTPKTSLLGKEYRTNIYSLSNELSGGINQILKYKDTLLKDWRTVSQDDDIIGFNPSCILIVGNLNELDNNDKVSNFELLRSNLKDVVIITFDEVLAKISNLIKSLSEN